MRKILVVTACLALLSGCATNNIPQTRDEFRNAASSGKGRVKSSTTVVNRSFESVYRDLRSRSSRCFNVREFSKISQVGNVPTGVSNYGSLMRRTGKHRAELTVKVKYSPEPVDQKLIPKGGFFMLAADIKGLSSGRTKVVTYGPIAKYDDVITSINDWAMGKGTTCPKMQWRSSKPIIGS